MQHQHLSQTKNTIAPPQSQSHASDRNYTHPIEELQGVLGNRAVNQLLAAQRERGRGGKATLSTTDSQYEAALAIQRKAFGEKVQGEAIPDEDKEIQRKASVQTENKTGLPDNLKAGIESLSGLAMDDVRVHYNSPKPVELNALAYTQGKEIYVTPGQEKHLPHEAWHVVQQMQGRVKPTMQMKGVEINDDRGLEKEAEAMGARLNNEDTNNLQWRVESKGQSSNTSHIVLKEQTKKNQPLLLETPLLTPTIQKMKTRYRQREEERRLEKQGLSIRHIVEGRRRTRKPDFLGQPPSSYLDRHENRLFNPGSAAIMRVRMKLSGDSRADIVKLIQRTGRGGPASGEVWHHMGDYDEQTGVGTIVLMPRAIHAANRHIGGSAMARAHIWDDPDRLVKYGIVQRVRVSSSERPYPCLECPASLSGLHTTPNRTPVQLYRMRQVPYTFPETLAVRQERRKDRQYSATVNYASLSYADEPQYVRMSGGDKAHSEMLVLALDIVKCLPYARLPTDLDQFDLNNYKEEGERSERYPIRLYTEKCPCGDPTRGGMPRIEGNGCQEVLDKALSTFDEVYWSFSTFEDHTGWMTHLYNTFPPRMI